MNDDDEVLLLKIAFEIPDEVFNDAVKILVAESGESDAEWRRKLTLICTEMMRRSLTEYLTKLDEYLILMKASPDRAISGIFAIADRLSDELVHSEEFKGNHNG